MANEQNLKPIRTKSEAREKGKNGGIASGKARAEQKALKAELELLLAMPAADGGTNQTRLSIALLNEGLAGNVRAFEIIRDTIGQKPTEKVEVAKNITDIADRIKEYARQKREGIIPAP